MRVEVHLVDGTVVFAESELGDLGVGGPLLGGQKGVHPMLSRLRGLRAKAKRLGVWRVLLADTERGLVDATLLLRRLGVRLLYLIKHVYLKLELGLRALRLERLRAAGLRAASTLVEFFGAQRLLCDGDYLLYLGVRELVAQNLRATPMPQKEEQK